MKIEKYIPLNLNEEFKKDKNLLVALKKYISGQVPEQLWKSNKREGWINKGIYDTDLVEGLISHFMKALESYYRMHNKTNEMNDLISSEFSPPSAALHPLELFEIFDKKYMEMKNKIKAKLEDMANPANDYSDVNDSDRNG